MTGKTLEQLTAAELRGECANRGISMSGSKADLIIRLEEDIRETGQDPANARFHPMQSLDETPTGNTGERRDALATLVDTGTPQPSWSASARNAHGPTLSGGHPTGTGRPPVDYAAGRVG